MTYLLGAKKNQQVDPAAASAAAENQGSGGDMEANRGKFVFVQDQIKRLVWLN